MLVLTRKIGERVVIGGDVCVTVLKTHGNRVRLGITGPPEVTIHREELARIIAHDGPPRGAPAVLPR
jgi:carbon storage regulator